MQANHRTLAMEIDSARLYTDFDGLAELRAKAGGADKDVALDEVARQFEGLLLQMMLKSMRQASFGGGLLDTEQSRFYRDMHDQQIAIDMANSTSLGLADLIKQQLGGARAGRSEPRGPADYLADPIVSARSAPAGPADSGEVRSSQAPGVSASIDPVQEADIGDSPEGFLRALWPAAERAAAEIGLSPEALLAQAALETGWGRHVMSRNGGGSSHNLFGIKADPRWDGERVRRTTLEFKDGVALKTRAAFRAYDSFGHSLSDYVQFIQSNPRYRRALEQVEDERGYFRELQRAGYATDPKYAEKIEQILNSDVMQKLRLPRQPDASTKSDAI